MKGIKGFQSGSNHHNWKDKPSYDALHMWIKYHKPKSEICEDCGQKKLLHAANISGEYKRDINDFKWLCVLCHSKFDNDSGKKKIWWADQRAKGYRQAKDKLGRFISNVI